jgi:hypothetical protein
MGFVAPALAKYRCPDAYQARTAAGKDDADAEAVAWT